MEREVAAAIEKLYQKISNLERNAEVPSTYTKAEVDAMIAAATPVGEIIWSAADAAPARTLECLHQELSRTIYAALFAAVGTRFGAGNGATTFNAPWPGRVPVGYDAAQTEFNSVGKTGGEKAHQQTVGELATHTHVQDAHNHGQNPHTHGQDAHAHAIQRTNVAASGQGIDSSTVYKLQAGTGGSYSSTEYATATNQNTTATNQAATATNQNAGSSIPFNVMQPYEVLRKFIRY